MTAQLPTLRSVRARPALAPLARPLRTASGDIPVAPLVLIDVATEEGVPGRAYLFGYTAHMLKPLCGLVETIGGLVAGKSATTAKLSREHVRTLQIAYGSLDQLDDLLRRLG